LLSALDEASEEQMTLEAFAGFRSLETCHCVTGSMLHIFDFNGCPVSEEMLLGLGCGVGFIYWHQKGTDPFMGGRANFERPGEEGLENAASRRLGVKQSSLYTSSTGKAEAALRELLEAGQPAMLQVDMGYLPYFNFGGEEYHFGYHVIVVAGYDPKTRQVLIADRDLELHPVSWDDLAKARSSTCKPFAPRNRLYRYDFRGFHSPEPAEVILSVRETAARMLEPPIANIGVKGIRKAADRVPSWSETMDLQALRRACFNCFIFIDATGGSGGGLFRYMYGRYLREAAEITGESELVAVGDLFKQIGDRWQGVAEIFKRAAGSDDPAAFLPGVAEPLLVIADLEQTAWNRLAEIAGS
jgi:hypothetical protein